MFLLKTEIKLESCLIKCIFLHIKPFTSFMFFKFDSLVELARFCAFLTSFSFIINQ